MFCHQVSLWYITDFKKGSFCIIFWIATHCAIGYNAAAAVLELQQFHFLYTVGILSSMYLLYSTMYFILSEWGRDKPNREDGSLGAFKTHLSS